MNNKIILDEEQINFLFSFCKKHYVRYYDVQVELVDHLANAIEDKMSANNALSFEKALDEVYATFGYKGFGGIVEAKSKALTKKYSKMRWGYFWHYFTLPKILFTLAIILSLYFLGEIVAIKNLNIIIIVLVFGIWFFQLFYARKIYKQTKKISKHLLMVSIGAQTQTFFSVLLFQILYISIPISNKGSLTLMQYYFLSAMAIALLLIDLAQIEINKQILTKAKTDFPLAF